MADSRYTLAQACAMLDTYASIGADLYIDQAKFSGAFDRNQDLADVLHRAAVEVYSEAGYFYGPQALTLGAGENEIPFTDQGICEVAIVAPTNIMINGSWLYGTDRQRGPLSWDEFSRRYRDWKTASNGSPSAWAVTPWGSVVFNKPLSTALDTTNKGFMEGFGHPHPWDYNDSNIDVWAVDARLQRAVIDRAVYEGCMWAATEATRVGQLERHLDRAKADIEKFRREASGALSSVQDSEPLTVDRGVVWL